MNARPRLIERASSLWLATLNLLLLGASLAWVAWPLGHDAEPQWSHAQAMWLPVGVVLAALFLTAGMPLITLVFAIFDLVRGCRRQGVLSAAVALALLLLHVGWVATADSYASREEARVGLEWARVQEPMSLLLARFPDTSPSDGARRLEATAARVGIAFNPGGAKGAHPAEEDRLAHRAVRTQLSEFVSSQTDNAIEIADVPPEAASAWLSAHQRDLEALANAVLSGGPIAFESGWPSPERAIPNLRALRDVVAVLIFYAFESMRRGDAKASLDAIEAAWGVGASLRDRAELVSQISSISLDAMVRGALRKVNDVPPSWQGRMAQQDYRGAMLLVFQAEAWSMSATVERLNAPRPATLTARWSRAVSRPYMRRMATNHSSALTALVAGLRDTDRCVLDGNAVDRKAREAIGRWNVLGRIGMSGHARAWLSAVRAALDVEMTSKVLTMREIKRATGNWPAELTGLESAVCRGVRWSYATSPWGGVSLTLDPQVPVGLPLAFRASAPPGTSSGS